MSDMSVNRNFEVIMAQDREKLHSYLWLIIAIMRSKIYLECVVIINF